MRMIIVCVCNNDAVVQNCRCSNTHDKYGKKTGDEKRNDDGDDRRRQQYNELRRQQQTATVCRWVAAASAVVVH